MNPSRLLVVLALVVLMTPIARAELRLNRIENVAPASLHDEPQVDLDCAASTLKLEPCATISHYLWEWINHQAYCVDAAYSAAMKSQRSAQTTTIFCNQGIRSDRRTRPGGRWSQHRYGRACDGDHIIVDTERFNYLDAVAADRSGTKAEGRHHRSFTKFLDCWGTPGIGARPDGGLTFDYNRGVRDWREDPSRHSGHFHLSKPCLFCNFGDMAYE